MLTRDEMDEHTRIEDAKRKTRPTPGPWTVERDGTTISMDGAVVIIAPAPDGASYATQQANARLIAAAPALYEALVRAASVLVAASEIACASPMMENPLVTELQTAGGAVQAALDALAIADGKESVHEV